MDTCHSIAAAFAAGLGRSAALGEAAQLLAGGLTVSADLVAETRAVCGSWPLLLSLVHGAVAEAARAGGNSGREMQEILTALHTDGITALDVANPDQRSQAAARTIAISLARLRPDERERYAELAVFAEDVRVPGDGPIDWGDLAGAAGYFDQAHFGHEFRSFTGLTPTRYVEVRRRFLGEHSGHVLDGWPLPAD